MSNTNYFKPGSLGQSRRATRLIGDSEVIKVGDWITDEATGAANIDGTGEKVLGFCTSIVTADKLPLESASVDTGELGGTWTASTKSYTAAADNTTVDGVLVEYIPAKEGDQFIVTLDAAKGTTTGSDKAGYYLAVLTTDSAYVDESTAATSAASTQFRIVDPYNQGTTTQVVVEVLLRQTDQYTQD